MPETTPTSKYRETAVGGQSERKIKPANGFFATANPAVIRKVKKRSTIAHFDLQSLVFARKICRLKGFGMLVRHEDDDLARVEADPEYTGKLDKSRVRAFRKVLNILRAIPNETSIYQHKALRFEKLKGREPERSLRLNNQWRLIVEIESGEAGNCIVVKRIEDYH